MLTSTSPGPGGAMQGPGDNNGPDRANDNDRDKTRDVDVHKNVDVNKNVNVHKTVDKTVVMKARANVTAPRKFHIAAYVRPQGWYAHRWTYGETLPRAFFASEFVLADFAGYGLMAPWDGYEWVRYGDDALLIDEGTFVELGIHGRPHFSQRAMDGVEFAIAEIRIDRAHQTALLPSTELCRPRSRPRPKILIVRSAS